MYGNQAMEQQTQASLNHHYATEARMQSQNALLASGLTAGQLGEKTPLLNQEQARVEAALSDLENQLDWLIQRIQPICQPPCPMPETSSKDAAGQIQASPSGFRQNLMDLRHRIDAMSYRIAGVKHTIEV